METVIIRLSIIWSDKTKRDFFAMAVMVLLYECTTWTLTKCMEKKTRWGVYKNIMCCFEQILEGATHKNSNYTATYFPSYKPSK